MFIRMSLSSELTKIILSIVKENFESDYNVLLKSGLLEFLLNQLDWIKLIYFWWYRLNHQYPAQYQITV